jgi:protein dithiol oxidoreductase (disulfide-forming)
MRRASLWLLLAVMPIAACNAQQSEPSAAEHTAAAPAVAPATDPHTHVAANDTASSTSVAGADRYVVLPKPQPTQAPGKIEVAEVFLYTCPHCYAFEPAVTAWKNKLPSDVVFVRIPASFGPTGPLLSRTYYAAEALGVLDKMHMAIFEAIHKDRRALNTEEDVIKLFAEHGVDPEAMRATLRSFAVDSKARRAQQLEVGYGITGVPAMTVNGKYGISISKLGEQGMLKVADELIAKERKAAQ